ELATSHREKFKKFYDFSDRVIPAHILDQNHNDNDQINWLCDTAIDKLSFATLKEVQKFWDATDRSEVKTWFDNHKNITPIKWQTSDGDWVEGVGAADIKERLESLEKPTTRLRILNPFDPAIRDRDRLNQLFGFEYKIEIFVPAAKRKWGYYVYPILEGDRFVGRIDLKADRKKGHLNVLNFWTEKNIKWGRPRYKKLETELTRLSTLAGLTEVNSDFQK
ncbi:MAG: crosslink repair DNA glycosylase YcaQ family protein, partial [Emcibacteraceae bacterium]|nr:crosslink repair DNA glycosylase YcaQ family protein [Emcibacteraceae bacterium]